MIRFADSYANLVRQIMSEESDYEMNQRTRSGIAFLPEGHSLAIDLHDNVLPTCGLRRSRPHLAAAEAAWCLMGHGNVKWLQRHTKIWDAFADEDGNILEAYGYRWSHAFGYDQMQTAINRLIADPSDRRVWISSWDPRHDLRPKNQKTVPCPVGFTLSISGGRLNSSLMIRSSDVVIGLPLDVMRHALVMRAVANSLSVNLGYMRVNLAHPHIYENQWPVADMMLEQDISVPDIKMPKLPWTVVDVIEKPDDYVAMIREQADLCDWPEYDPRVVVVK